MRQSTMFCAGAVLLAITGVSYKLRHAPKFSVQCADVVITAQTGPIFCTDDGHGNVTAGRQFSTD